MENQEKNIGESSFNIGDTIHITRGVFEGHNFKIKGFVAGGVSVFLRDFIPINFRFGSFRKVYFNPYSMEAQVDRRLNHIWSQQHEMNHILSL